MVFVLDSFAVTMLGRDSLSVVLARDPSTAVVFILDSFAVIALGRDSL